MLETPEVTGGNENETPPSELSDDYYSDDLDDILAGSTKSVTESVYAYHKENGRTYHSYNAGSYHFPNDANEVERLEYQHIVLHHCLEQKLFFAPLPSPESLALRLPYDYTSSASNEASMHILDIGTGTGIWANELGDLYPSASIEATDLSPIQGAAPPNVQFIIDDAEQADWAVPEECYDYIHTRVLLGSFKDFKGMLTTAYKHLKEGAWIESQEIDMLPRSDDGSMPTDWPLLKWARLILETGDRIGRSLDIAVMLKQWYEEAGFVDVQERIFLAPIGRWEESAEKKDLGHWWAENITIGLQGFSLALLCRERDWSKNEVEVFLVNVRKSLQDKDVHAYHNVHVVTGRKPTEAEVKAMKKGKHPHEDDGAGPSEKKMRTP